MESWRGGRPAPRVVGRKGIWGSGPRSLLLSVSVGGLGRRPRAQAPRGLGPYASPAPPDGRTFSLQPRSSAALGIDPAARLGADGRGRRSSRPILAVPRPLSAPPPPRPPPPRRMDHRRSLVDRGAAARVADAHHQQVLVGRPAVAQVHAARLRPRHLRLQQGRIQQTVVLLVHPAGRPGPRARAAAVVVVVVVALLLPLLVGGSRPRSPVRAARRAWVGTGGRQGRGHRGGRGTWRLSYSLTRRPRTRRGRALPWGSPGTRTLRPASRGRRRLGPGADDTASSSVSAWAPAGDGPKNL